MKKSGLSFCCLLFVLFAFSLGVLAQEPLVSTVFFETDVRDAVNELIFQTGINIIMDETVRGIVTLDLRMCPGKGFDHAFNGRRIQFPQIDDYYFLGDRGSEEPVFSVSSGNRVHQVAVHL